MLRAEEEVEGLNDFFEAIGIHRPKTLSLTKPLSLLVGGEHPKKEEPFQEKLPLPCRRQSMHDWKALVTRRVFKAHVSF